MSPPVSRAYLSRVSLTPSAASLRLAPWVVLFSSMTTPFWFFMVLTPAPPPTVPSGSGRVAPAEVGKLLQVEDVSRRRRTGQAYLSNG